MKNKKAVEWQIMVGLIIAVFVFVILAFMVNKYLRDEGSQTSGYLDDYDNDGVVDNLDKCQCDYGEEDYDGCPEECEYTIDQKTACQEAMKDEKETGIQCSP